MSEEFERGVAEGIHRALAAMRATCLLEGPEGVKRILREETTADEVLQRRDDRVRAEVLAEVQEVLCMIACTAECSEAVEAATYTRSSDALNLALAEAREAGRREAIADAAAFSILWGLLKLPEPVGGLDEAVLYLGDREREAAAKALDGAYAEIETRLGTEHLVGAALRIIDTRAAALRSPAEGGE